MRHICLTHSLSFANNLWLRSELYRQYQLLCPVSLEALFATVQSVCTILEDHHATKSGDWHPCDVFIPVAHLLSWLINNLSSMAISVVKRKDSDSNGNGNQDAKSVHSNLSLFGLGAASVSLQVD